MTDQLKHDIAVETLIKYRHQAIDERVPPCHWDDECETREPKPWREAMLLVGKYPGYPNLIRYSTQSCFLYSSCVRDDEGLVNWLNPDFDLQSIYKPVETEAANADRSLVCKFVRTGPKVVFEVLHQDESLRSEDHATKQLKWEHNGFTVGSAWNCTMHPDSNTLWLLGEEEPCDNTSETTFDSVQAAHDYTAKAVAAIEAVPPRRAEDTEYDPPQPCGIDSTQPFRKQSPLAQYALRLAKTNGDLQYRGTKKWQDAASADGKKWRPASDVLLRINPSAMAMYADIDFEEPKVTEYEITLKVNLPYACELCERESWLWQRFTETLGGVLVCDKCMEEFRIRTCQIGKEKSE